MVIAASLLPPATTNRSGYDASRTVSHRDLSWRPFSSTSTCPTCQTPSPEKYTYADDLAIMHADGDWQAVKGVPSEDMATLSEYLQTWKLKLSTTKTVSAIFHLNNKEAKRELKVNSNKEIPSFSPEPKYLGVTLDRSLTYCRHLRVTSQEVDITRRSLRRLSGSSWGAGATTLRTATISLVHSTQSTALLSCAAVLIPRAGPSRCGAQLQDLGAGPNARLRPGVSLSSDFMTSSCSVNRLAIVVERRYALQH